MWCIPRRHGNCSSKCRWWCCTEEARFTKVLADAIIFDRRYLWSWIIQIQSSVSNFLQYLWKNQKASVTIYKSTDLTIVKTWASLIKACVVNKHHAYISLFIISIFILHELRLFCMRPITLLLQNNRHRTLIRPRTSFSSWRCDLTLHLKHFRLPNF